MASAATFVDILQERAATRPGATAYTFLDQGEREAGSLTFGALDRRARAIAATLQTLCAPGDRALLVYPPGLDYVAAFFGALYAEVIAVPVYPPSPGRQNRTQVRFSAVMQDASPAVALTTAAVRDAIDGARADHPELGAAQWIATDQIADEESSAWRKPAIAPETIAFLQYTSGSTAAPKGVIVTHGNLLHNEALIKTLCRHDEHSSFVGWLPLYHDMGLIGNVLQPLYLGSSCVLMSPAAFLQQPLRWLRAISRCRAATSGGPNFAYDLCVRKIAPEERAALDLRSWTTAFNGAEPVRAETMRRFVEAFEPCGFQASAFFPCYGMAETTLIVSGARADHAPRSLMVDAAALEAQRLVPATPSLDTRRARELVSCGRAAGGQRIVIADPATSRLCEPGTIGEIWVSGQSVARGYWNREEESARTFGACLADASDAANDAAKDGARFLRTGDLGTLDGEELFVVGRLKDLIIIRGRNLHPEDLEATAERVHPSLRPGCGAAFAIEAAAEDGGEEQVALAHEVERATAADVDAIARAIRDAISRDHAVSVHTIVLLRKGTIPKTTSGKIQRRACRTQFLDGTLEEIGRSVTSANASGPDEQRLADALRDRSRADRLARIRAYLEASLRGLTTPIAPASADDPLSAYGLDSLGAAELQSRLEVDLGLVLPASVLLDGQTIASLAADLLDRFDANTDAGRRDERKPSHLADDAASTGQAGQAVTRAPLSYNQRSLWFLHRLAPASAAYHIARAMALRGPIDAAALESAWQQVIARHAALRTTIEAVDGDGDHDAVAQCVHRNLPWTLSTQAVPEDWTDDDLAHALHAEAVRPFDLASTPPLRVRLFTRGAQDGVLLLCGHHILLDFWSLGVMLREVQLLYDADRRGTQVQLPPVTTSYLEFTRWQHDLLASAEGARLRDYWLTHLADASAPPLNLPSDRPRPAVQQYRGDSLHLRLDAALTERLTQLARAQGSTLSTILLAAFQLLLMRLSGQRAVIIGLPGSGRSRARFDGVVGYCVNPLACAARLDGNPTFGEFATQVRRTVLGAMAHQDYPFARLVEEAQPERDPSRSPIFQSMFVWQRAQGDSVRGADALALNLPGAPLSLFGLPGEILPLEMGTAQLDLRLMMARIDETLCGWLEFNADLFDASTARRIAHAYEQLLRSTVTQPETGVRDLPLMDAQQRDQIVHAWNDTARDYTRDVCVPALIEAQVRRAPSAIAVVDTQGAWTYAEIDARANQLARLLRARGVRRGAMVAVVMDRSAHMIIAVLGIMKAGAAYVPIEPAYPAARARWILQAMAVRCAIAGDRQLARIEEERANVPSLQDIVCLTRDASALDAQPTDTLAIDASSDDVAYVIFTSGSTGTPKGVVVQHRPVINVIEWVNRTMAIVPEDRLLFTASLCFDLSVYDIFGILAAGASLRVATEEELREPARLLDILIDEPITVWDSAPAALQQLTPFMALRREDTQPRPLRIVLLSGDWIPVALPDQIRDAFPRARVMALGGATEATVWSNLFPIDRVAPHWSSIPYGKPIQNARYYVLDDRLAPCLPGVPGELYIGGECLSCGYANEPALTARKYVPDPFGAPGARAYRTGDLARYFADGNLEFLGRVDHQVKIRGFRVELGEIEAALVSHPSVREALVVARGEARGLKTLVAYVVRNDAYDVREDGVTAAALQAYVRARLPEYMTPGIVMFLDALPLTANGKVDRASLPSPASARREDGDAAVAPRTPLEQELAAIWAEVLELDSVGVEDSFFALGGHSLLMTQVISRIRVRWQVDLPVAAFFQAPTVAGLATQLLEQLASRQDDATLERLLSQVETMPVETMAAEQIDVWLDAVSGGADRPRAARERDGQREGDRQREGGAAASLAVEANAGSISVRRGDLHRVDVGQGFDLVSDPAATSTGAGAGRLLKRDAADLLWTCESFATPRAHAEAWIRARGTHAAGVDDVEAIEAQLRDYAASGLMQEATQLAASVVRPRAPQPEPPTAIGTLAFLTCDRPALVRRGLGSYIDNCRQYGRAPSVIVIDDGRDARKAEACRETVAAMARESGLDISYVDRRARAELAARLASISGVPHATAAFALCGEERGVSTAGAVRNTLALLRAGDCVMTVDDDTVCRIGRPPEARDGVEYVSRSYAPELYPAADRRTLIEGVPFVERDFIGLHESVLGRTAASVAEGQPADAIAFDAATPAFARRLAAGQGRIVATFTGYVGDCGWASPSNYLFLSGASLDRLVSSEEAYERACTSRDCLQMVNRLTVSDRADYVMMAFASLDQRDLPPPFLPIGRGQDNLFGATLTRMGDAACVAHLPYGLLHLPEEPRAFWAGEVTRSASGLDLATLIGLCLGSAGTPLPGGRAAGLTRLGRHLQDIGALAPSEFEACARTLWREEGSRLIAHLEFNLARRGGEPAWWAADVRQFIALLRKSLARADAFIPLDLATGSSMEAAARTAQDLVRRFGDLLVAWPALVQAARELRTASPHAVSAAGPAPVPAGVSLDVEGAVR